MEYTIAKRGYVICSEHRSGSTLLCRLLNSTGQLGHPDEIFRHPADSARIEHNPVILDAIIAEATTANQVYGLKVFSQQFDVTSKARWTERLPGLRYVHLERGDLLGQAISMVKALQTQQYFADQISRAKPHYDPRAIARHIARIAEGQSRWRRFFARNGITPVWLTYERLIADPQMAIDQIAALVGVTKPCPIDEDAIHLSVQRDATSDDWRARFIAEHADLHYLDHPLGRRRVWLRRFARDVFKVLRND